MAKKATSNLSKKTAADQEVAPTPEVVVKKTATESDAIVAEATPAAAPPVEAPKVVKKKLPRYVRESKGQTAVTKAVKLAQPGRTRAGKLLTKNVSTLPKEEPAFGPKAKRLF